jgi:hypothetical protein
MTDIFLAHGQAKDYVLQNLFQNIAMTFLAIQKHKTDLTLPTILQKLLTIQRALLETYDTSQQLSTQFIRVGKKQTAV